MDMETLAHQALLSSILFVGSLVGGTVIGFVLGSRIGRNAFFSLPVVRFINIVATVLVFLMCAKSLLHVNIVSVPQALLCGLVTLMIGFNLGRKDPPKK
jgi:hypothetical protein